MGSNHRSFAIFLCFACVILAHLYIGKFESLLHPSAPTIELQDVPSQPGEGTAKERTERKGEAQKEGKWSAKLMGSSIRHHNKTNGDSFILCPLDRLVNQTETAGLGAASLPSTLASLCMAASGSWRSAKVGVLLGVASVAAAEVQEANLQGSSLQQVKQDSSIAPTLLKEDEFLETEEGRRGGGDFVSFRGFMAALSNRAGNSERFLLKEGVQQADLNLQGAQVANLDEEEALQGRRGGRRKKYKTVMLFSLSGNRAGNSERALLEMLERNSELKNELGDANRGPTPTPTPTPGPTPKPTPTPGPKPTPTAVAPAAAFSMASLMIAEPDAGAATSVTFSFMCNTELAIGDAITLGLPQWTLTGTVAPTKVGCGTTVFTTSTSDSGTSDARIVYEVATVSMAASTQCAIISNSATTKAPAVAQSANLNTRTMAATFAAVHVGNIAPTAIPISTPVCSKNCLGRTDLQNTGQGLWNTGHCTIGSPTLSSFTGASLRIGVGDGGADSMDWALFMPLQGNGGGDFAGCSVWAFGGESHCNDARPGTVTITGSATTGAAVSQVLFQAQGAETAFKNIYPFWYSAGGTVTGGSGKRAAYDNMPLSKLKFSDSSGKYIEYRLGAKFVGKTLLAIVQECLGGAAKKAPGAAADCCRGSSRPVNTCSCKGGKEAKGAACPAHNFAVCTSCNAGYKKRGSICRVKGLANMCVYPAIVDPADSNKCKVLNPLPPPKGKTWAAPPAITKTACAKSESALALCDTPRKGETKCGKYCCGCRELFESIVITEKSTAKCKVKQKSSAAARRAQRKFKKAKAAQQAMVAYCKEPVSSQRNRPWRKKLNPSKTRKKKHMNFEFTTTDDECRVNIRLKVFLCQHLAETHKRIVVFPQPNKKTSTVTFGCDCLALHSLSASGKVIYMKSTSAQTQKRCAEKQVALSAGLERLLGSKKPPKNLMTSDQESALYQWLKYNVWIMTKQIVKACKTPAAQIGRLQKELSQKAIKEEKADKAENIAKEKIQKLLQRQKERLSKAEAIKPPLEKECNSTAKAKKWFDQAPKEKQSPARVARLNKLIEYCDKMLPKNTNEIGDLRRKIDAIING